MLDSNEIKQQELAPGNSDYWRRHFNCYQGQSDSKRMYAESAGLIYHRFIYWCRKFERDEVSNSPRESKTGFIPVTVKPAAQHIEKNTPLLATLEFDSGKRLLIHNEQALKILVELG